MILRKDNKKEEVNTAENITEEIEEEEVIVEQEEIGVEEEPLPLLHSAWIPAWDFNNGYSSLQKHKELVKEVNPVFYGVNSDGTLLNRKPSEESVQKLLTLSKSEDIEIIPTIGSYDYKILESVLQSDVYIQKHITEIVKEIEKYDFDGIDIDYEKIRSTEKEGYIKFLTDLKTELTKKEKILSVTVVAKTRDGTQDTLLVQDWKRIGEIADRVKIMTYDFTLQTSTTPGPIGPITWINDVLKYSEDKIAPNKISLGIHLYAYLWKDNKASALTQTSVEKILENTNIKKEYKEDIAEGYTQYICSDNATCTLYYQTPQGIAKRVQIAKENNLLGVSYWRLGGELDLLDQ
jgi:spore germination protein YaaH